MLQTSGANMTVSHLLALLCRVSRAWLDTLAYSARLLPQGRMGLLASQRDP